MALLVKERRTGLIFWYKDDAASPEKGRAA